MKYLNDKEDKKRGKKKGSKQEADNNSEEIVFHNLYFPQNKVDCDGCQKDITKQARVLCMECPNTSDICMNCFLNLVEFEKHETSHPYRIISKLNFPLFVEEWTAEEELLMMEGLEKKGFGNWQDIQEMLNNDKTIEDIAQHYDEIILSGKYLKMNLMTSRDPSTLELIKPKIKQSQKKPQQIQIKQQDSKKNNQPLTNQIGQEIVGYMPNRGDFDIEFDNDAELLLAEMEFNDDDKPSEVDMKFKVLDIYNLRLNERIKRKEFVISRDLLNLKKQNILDRQRNKEEKELHNLMKPFARFNTAEGHDKLVQNLIREKQLRAKIEELRNYRKMGLKTFEDIEAYLAQKRKQDEAYQRRQKQNDSFVYEKAQPSRYLQRRTRLVPMLEGRDNQDRKHRVLPHFSEEEYNLCEKMGLAPHEYLILKEVLIRESVRHGYINKDQAIQNFKMDKERVTGVYDYLVTKGLVHQKD